jgi:hypothetical protein
MNNDDYNYEQNYNTNQSQSYTTSSNNGLRKEVNFHKEIQLNSNTANKVTSIFRLIILLIGIVLVILTVIKEREKSLIDTSKIQTLQGEVINVVKDTYTDTDGDRRTSYKVTYQAEDGGKLKVSYGSSTIYKKGDKVTMYKYDKNYALSVNDLKDDIVNMSFLKIVDSIYIWLFLCWLIMKVTKLMDKTTKKNGKKIILIAIWFVAWVIAFKLVDVLL